MRNSTGRADWYSGSSMSDDFRFKTVKYEPFKKLTKRQLLSNIAGIYDPLQWLASMIVCARIWKSGIGWGDATRPMDALRNRAVNVGINSSFSMGTVRKYKKKRTAWTP